MLGFDGSAFDFAACAPDGEGWSKGERRRHLQGRLVAILYDRHAIIKTGASQSSTKRLHECGCGDHPHGCTSAAAGIIPLFAVLILGFAVGAATRAGALQLPARARPSSNP